MSSLSADQIISRLLTLMSPLDLLRVADMKEAEHLSGLSAETLTREHPDLIMKLSARRNGMRVAHALMLRDADQVEQVETAIIAK
jgi:hypothetical protein